MDSRTPAEWSAQALKEFAVFRHGDAPAAAAAHARNLGQTGGWSFNAQDLLEPLDPDLPLADSPADLSEALAGLLLARTAESQQQDLPASGVDVSDTDWAEFERWGGSKPS